MSERQARRQATRLFRVCLVNSMLDEDRARQVVQRVVAAGKRDCPAILQHFLRLVKSDQARRTATIESAVPLAADLMDEVQAGLTRRYGVKLSFGFAVSPVLIGGMRIRVGSDVYDCSVRARLVALEDSF